jgi:hypothetical protein
LNHYPAEVAGYIKEYRQTGKQEAPLRSMATKAAPIHPDEVGIFAAHLLSQEDPSAHNGAKYVLNRPEDITGEQMVRPVEQYISTKVEDVKYQDMSFIDALLDSGFGGPGQSRTVVGSIRYAANTM